MVMIDIRSFPAVSWSQKERLPDRAGVYFVVADLRLKADVALPVSIPYLSTSVLQTLLLSRGGSLVFYVGMSGDINKRWNGSTSHHKERCIEVMSTLLSRVFTVDNLRIHYARSNEKTGNSKKARQLEEYFIRLLKPVLNGLPPLAKVSRKKRHQRSSRSPSHPLRAA